MIQGNYPPMSRGTRKSFSILKPVRFIKRPILMWPGAIVAMTGLCMIASGIGASACYLYAVGLMVLTISVW